MAEDFRLADMVPVLLAAIPALTPEAWDACLHHSNSPVPRAIGLKEGIVDKRLGPIGSYHLPFDLWNEVIPPFLRGGVPKFDAKEGWEDRDRPRKGASPWVSPEVQCLVHVLRWNGSIMSRRIPSHPLATLLPSPSPPGKSV